MRRTVAPALLLLVAVIGTIAPAAAQAPRIGFVIVARVQEHARVYEDGAARLARVNQDLKESIDRERQFRFLSGEKAARAVVLDTKGAERTQEEGQEYFNLSSENDRLALEYVRLVGRQNPTEADTARLRELQAIRDAREDQVMALQEQLVTQLYDAQAEIIKGQVDVLVSALQTVAQQNGLDVILAAQVPTYPEVGEGPGHTHDLNWTNVIFYGGLDVTDKVITVMNGGEAPPARAEGEYYIPGAVVAQ
jgi:Skp family chaperone for outer membrane proteins